MLKKSTGGASGPSRGGNGAYTVRSVRSDVVRWDLIGRWRTYWYMVVPEAAHYVATFVGLQSTRVADTV